ncbi:MAG: hypothetical protein GXY05_16645 [Clostridiales bacterium]|nr:hypothetical protein [Clostridiales bacterium]
MKNKVVESYVHTIKGGKELGVAETLTGYFGFDTEEDAIRTDDAFHVIETSATVRDRDGVIYNITANTLSLSFEALKKEAYAATRAAAMAIYGKDIGAYGLIADDAEIQVADSLDAEAAARRVHVIFSLECSKTGDAPHIAGKMYPHARERYIERFRGRNPETACLIWPKYKALLSICTGADCASSAFIWTDVAEEDLNDALEIAQYVGSACNNMKIELIADRQSFEGKYTVYGISPDICFEMAE